ncbi:MAG TPA: tetratricopeptide repeat protein, partial [Leptospiraceae bacterium]|nr:tetratricopeptide repeat protein [Leptospiraceae bacterium]HNO21690.1 tetratricopeptide repeat protein [Leptospiraceae bacterium]
MNIPEEHIENGEKLLKNGNFEGAVSSFSKAIDLVPDNPYYYYKRGRAYEESKDYEKALKDFVKGSSLDSKSALYVSAAAGVYEAQENYDKALEFFQKSCSLDSRSAWDHYKVGDIHFINKKYSEAVSWFTKAIELKEDEYYCYRRGKAYLELGDRESAKRDFSRAVQISPDYKLGLMERAPLLFEEGDYEGCISDYTALIEKYGGQAYLYYFRGKAYFELQKYAEAAADFSESIKLDPSDINCFLKRGDAYLY